MNVNSRTITLDAGADLSSSQYNLTMLDENGNVVLATADAVVIGSLQNKPKEGEAATIAIGETVKVVAGGDVAIGDLIVSNASGKGIARTTEHNIFGISLEEGSDDSIIEVLVRPLYM
jgi:hypothetical protein